MSTKHDTLDNSPSAHRRPRVLVVDDEPRLRSLLADVVPEMGFEVTTARSGEEGLRAMEQNPHEIAILDLNLPVMHGMDVFSRIREQWPATQVIVITGFGDLPAARSAIRLDVVDFLTKPCHLRDVEVALDRARRRIDEQRGTVPVSTTAEPIVPATTGLPTTLADVERRQIMESLARNDGNRTRTAAELGISRRTLHYRLREYGMHR
jgi:DNA-binding NtrC family response regulator